MSYFGIAKDKAGVNHHLENIGHGSKYQDDDPFEVQFPTMCGKTTDPGWEVVTRPWVDFKDVTCPECLQHPIAVMVKAHTSIQLKYRLKSEVIRKILRWEDKSQNWLAGQLRISKAYMSDLMTGRRSASFGLRDRVMGHFPDLEIDDVFETTGAINKRINNSVDANK